MSAFDPDKWEFYDAPGQGNFQNLLLKEREEEDESGVKELIIYPESEFEIVPADVEQIGECKWLGGRVVISICLIFCHFLGRLLEEIP